MLSYIFVFIKRFSSDVLYSTFFPHQETHIQIISPYKEATQLKVLFYPLGRSGCYVYHRFNNKSP
jgi:hypothetical protein